MPATIPIAFDDFNEWQNASKLPMNELEDRAEVIRACGGAIVLLSRGQLRRWRKGLLTPWRVPDHLTVTATNPLRTWPILESQLKG